MFRSVLFMLSSSALALAQTHHGTLFNFVPGLGACGFTNTSSQLVASVSSQFFNSYPGATANPNNNPICHHHVNITSGNTSATAQIVDYFVEKNAQYNVGLPAPAFEKFAPLDQGIVANVSWVVL